MIDGGFGKISHCRDSEVSNRLIKAQLIGSTDELSKYQSRKLMVNAY